MIDVVTNALLLLLLPTTCSLVNRVKVFEFYSKKVRPLKGLSFWTLL